MTSPSTILLTGAAGFIGSHLAEQLIRDNRRVIGVDNFCDFYDPAIKRQNLTGLLSHDRFQLIEADIRDRETMDDLCRRHHPHAIIHIAAMAGVRPSIERPDYYTQVNIDGTVSLLDAAVHSNVQRFIFASSSSVYGNNTKVPFAESDPVDFPISPYAATKRAGELICHSYHHIHQLPVTCLRFFTVFGPRQRPDLAIAKFLRLAEADRPIPMFGDGSTSRDYTYIDDIVSGVLNAMERCHGFNIYNLGGHDPVTLKQMIDTIAQVTGKALTIQQMPMQPGDVNRTWADITRAQKELDYLPTTSLAQGIGRQWQWMQQHR